MGKVNEVKTSKISIDASNRRNTHKVMRHESPGNNSGFSVQSKAGPTACAVAGK